MLCISCGPGHSLYSALPPPLRAARRAEYERMADAIQKVAKETGAPPLLFSLCQWGRVRARVSPVSRL